VIPSVGSSGASYALNSAGTAGGAAPVIDSDTTITVSAAGSVPGSVPGSTATPSGGSATPVQSSSPAQGTSGGGSLVFGGAIADAAKTGAGSVSNGIGGELFNRGVNLNERIASSGMAGASAQVNGAVESAQSLAKGAAGDQITGMPSTAAITNKGEAVPHGAAPITSHPTQ